MKYITLIDELYFIVARRNHWNWVREYKTRRCNVVKNKSISKIVK